MLYFSVGFVPFCKCTILLKLIGFSKSTKSSQVSRDGISNPSFESSYAVHRAWCTHCGNNWCHNDGVNERT